jgi:hypothetical protein
MADLGDSLVIAPDPVIKAVAGGLLTRARMQCVPFRSHRATWRPTHRSGSTSADGGPTGIPLYKSMAAVRSAIYDRAGPARPVPRRHTRAIGSICWIASASGECSACQRSQSRCRFSQKSASVPNSRSRRSAVSVVDPKAVLAFAVADQGFHSVPRWGAEGVEARRVLEHVELSVHCLPDDAWADLSGPQGSASTHSGPR